MNHQPPADGVPADGQPRPSATGADRLLRYAVFGIFLMLFVAVLYFGRDFLMPVMLAFVLSLVLSPVVRACARSGIPEWLTALALIILIVTGVIAGVYQLSEPASKWIRNASTIAYELQIKLMPVREPVKAVEEASAKVDEITEGANPEVQKVVLKEPGLLSRTASGAPEVIAKTGVALVLLFFLLASGDMFYQKLVRTLPTLADKKKGVRIARDVEREVSRYLLTICLINAGLGVMIGIGLYLVGMPNPMLWGIAAALLNFIPYLGALLGVAVVALVSVIAFPSLGQALVAPAVYLACNVLESQFITPLLVGRRLEINAVAVFIAVAFWGWLWGVIGALLAVPLLVIIKVFSDHVESLFWLGEFLAAREVPAESG